MHRLVYWPQVIQWRLVRSWDSVAGVLGVAIAKDQHSCEDLVPDKRVWIPVFSPQKWGIRLLPLPISISFDVVIKFLMWSYFWLSPTFLSALRTHWCNISKASGLKFPTIIKTSLTLSNFRYPILCHPQRPSSVAEMHAACSRSPHNVLHSPSYGLQRLV